MMCRAAKTALLVLLCVCIFGLFKESCADYYKYKDDKGSICITNVLESVPRRYRATMEVIPDGAPRKKVQTEQEQAKPAQPVADEQPTQISGRESPVPSRLSERFARLAERWPWLKPSAIICGMIAGFIIVIKLAGILPSPQMARLLYIAFFLGVFVFIYKSYVDYLVGGYLEIKHKFVTMFKNANERERLQGLDKPAGDASEESRSE
jgi:hypothetical protein